MASVKKWPTVQVCIGFFLINVFNSFYYHLECMYILFIGLHLGKHRHSR